MVLIVPGPTVVENVLVANDGPLLKVAFSVLALVCPLFSQLVIDFLVCNLSVMGISPVLSSLW